MSRDFRACHKRSFRGGERKRRSVTEPNTRTQKLKTKPSNRLIYVPRCQSKKNGTKETNKMDQNLLHVTGFQSVWTIENWAWGRRPWSATCGITAVRITDVRDLLFRSSPLTESPEQASKSTMRCYNAWWLLFVIHLLISKTIFEYSIS